MNILYIHQYFSTPKGTGGTRSYWIAQELLRRGHHVTMLTAGREETKRVNVDGIDVLYVKNPPYSNYQSAPRKVWAFLSFIRNAIREAKKENDVDLVFATSTPLTIGYIAMRLKRSKGWPYVFEVRDLWPEFPIQIGAIRNKWAIWYLRRLERHIYERSEHVVALSPGMKEGVIKAGTPEEKVSMIPNMSKPDEFFPHEPDKEIAQQFGIDLTKFNVIHFGSMGRANGLQYIIEAAHALKKRGDDYVRFIFLGSGATEPKLRAMAKEYGLDNVTFHGRSPMKTLAEVVNCCDASITTFLNLPVLQTNSPNKLFDSLSAGKPIIVNSAGWTKDMVEKEHCGFFADPSDPHDLAAKLEYYAKETETLKEWSENARRLSIEVYDKKILSAQVAEVLETAYAKL